MAVKWIKIATDIFNDEKILLIEGIPSADSILVIWLKLLTLAGKQNNSGVFMLNDRIAYTDEMLATIFRRDVNTVRLALKTFETYGMIELIEGVITIPNWSKHQSLDQIEKKNEYQKEYMKEYRAKQKQLICKTNVSTNCKTNCKTNVSSLDIDIELDKELDIDKDIDKDTDNNMQTETVCSDTKVSQIDFKSIIEKWNSNIYLATLTKLATNTKRYKSLKARVVEHGIENVLIAIDNITNSDFLQGKTKEAWIITFDWFVKPNNFIKVLENQYVTRGASNGISNGNSKSIEYSAAELTQINYRITDEQRKALDEIDF